MGPVPDNLSAEDKTELRNYLNSYNSWGGPQQSLYDDGSAYALAGKLCGALAVAAGGGGAALLIISRPPAAGGSGTGSEPRATLVGWSGTF